MLLSSGAPIDLATGSHFVLYMYIVGHGAGVSVMVSQLAMPLATIRSALLYISMNH